MLPVPGRRLRSRFVPRNRLCRAGGSQPPRAGSRHPRFADLELPGPRAFPAGGPRSLGTSAEGLGRPQRPGARGKQIPEAEIGGPQNPASPSPCRPGSPGPGGQAARDELRGTVGTWPVRDGCEGPSSVPGAGQPRDPGVV